MTDASVRPVAETTQSESLVESSRQEAPVPGALIVFSGREPLYRTVVMTPGVTHVVGRDDLVGVAVPDERVSRQHAELRYESGVFQVRDLDSRNGTFLDGRKVDGAVEARAGSVLRFANTLLLLLDDLGPFRLGHVRCDDFVVGPQMQKVLDEVALARRRACHVLIHGESGTGKEMVARHYFESDTPRRAYVTVNCATVPDNLATGLFFGWLRGAFTEARADHVGFLEAASDGVLFLDEVAELGAGAQATLLRGVETGEVLRLGSTTPSRVSVRIVSASYSDLGEAVGAGDFRQDLYFRLAQFRVELLPLCERREEIPWLMRHALNGQALGLHARAVELALLRRWPGNVRELLSATRNAAAVAHRAESETLRAEHFDADAGNGPGQGSSRAAANVRQDAAPSRADAARPERPAGAARAAPGPGRAGAGTYTRQQLVDALNAANWNVSVAARALNMNRTQLYREMERCGITRELDGVPPVAR